jgi:hypothetical protein
MPDDITFGATVAQDIRAADETLIAEDVMAFVNLAGLTPVLTVHAALGLNSFLVDTTRHVDIV